MSEVIVSSAAEFMDCKDSPPRNRRLIGHVVSIGSNDYFVAPTMPYLKIFTMESGGIPKLLKDVYINKQIIEQSSTQESHIEYLRNNIKGLIEGWPNWKNASLKIAITNHVTKGVDFVSRALRKYAIRGD